MLLGFENSGPRPVVVSLRPVKFETSSPPGVLKQKELRYSPPPVLVGMKLQKDLNLTRGTSLSTQFLTKKFALDAGTTAFKVTKF